MANPTMHVFTDGAASKNGFAGCKAAWAYYITYGNLTAYKAGDVPCIEIPGQKYSASNNRGELMAILEGMKMAQSILTIQQPSARAQVTIVTDSDYSMKSITVWGPSWYAKGANALADKKNLDIIKPAIDLFAELQKVADVKFMHMRSHKPEPVDDTTQEWFLWNGNDAADVLCAVKCGTLDPKKRKARKSKKDQGITFD